jgi:hypothetical protein
MKTVADPAVLAALTTRLEQLTPTQQRVWGTMNPQQMAAHLADAAEAVLGRRSFSTPARGPSRVMKWAALYLPMPWPRGVRSGADPASRSLQPETFATERSRAIAALAALAAAPAAGLAAHHPLFGPMARGDWLRWAYLHTDHHLRQFGL